MSKKTLVLVSVLALTIGGLLFAAPSTSQADPITISRICVTVGDTTWGSVGAGCGTGSLEIWDLDAIADGSPGNGSVTLLAEQTLVLTQNSGFNFDSSEGKLPSCNDAAGRHCDTTLSINALGSVVYASSALANFNIDPTGNAHNEAANWGSVVYPSIGGFGTVYFGYADNVHSNPCADGGNCLPSFGATNPTSRFADATYFLGAGADFPGGGGLPAGIKCTGVDDCFDAGAIMIYNTQVVPEPATMFLGTAGLLLLGYAARRRLFAR